MEKFIINNNMLEKYVGDEEHVVIPEGVTSIEYYAFRNCADLTSIEIPDSVTSIGYGAFEDCSSLTTVMFEEGSKLTKIENLAFASCGSLTSIVIPDSVKSIGGYAFCDCRGLTSITIPEGVTSIGSSAFSGCSNLTSIIIPSSVTSIGGNAFNECTNLKKVVFQKGSENLHIEEGAFSRTHIEFLNLTRKTYIWGENFPNVREIENIKNLLSITNFKNFNLNTKTQNGITRYKNIIISVDETVRNLYVKNGEILSIEALHKARNLRKLNLEELSIPLINYFEDTDWYKGDDFVPESLKEITIRKGSVADRALHHLTHIKTVVLGEEVTSLGYLALNHNYELNKLIIKNNKCKIAKAINDCDQLVIYR